MSEVTIVGAGLIGQSMALELAHQGVASVLIERRSLTHKPQDSRTSAINHGTYKWLDKIGVFSHIRPQATEIKTVAVQDITGSNNNNDASLYYDDSVLDVAPIGFMVRNEVLLNHMIEQVKTNELITLMDNQTIADITSDEFGHCLHIYNSNPDNDQTQKMHKCKLLIAADGKNSQIRKHFNISCHNYDYDQSALVFNIEHEKPHCNTALELFSDRGIIALLPFTGNTSAIVWSLEKQLAQQLQGNNDLLLTMLQQEITPWAGKIKIIDNKVTSYPLTATMAHKFIAQRMVLIGDSAHSIHPVAGQNFNVGMRDVERLARIIVQNNNLGIDIGQASALHNYRRRADAYGAYCVTHGVVKLFASKIPGMAKVRQLGLRAVNHMQPLKKLLMKKAIGV